MTSARAGQEANAQELDDVRVAEGAHQLTLSHELARRPLDPFRRRSSGVLEEVVYFLGGAHGSGYGHLLHATIGTRPYRGARGPSVGQQKRAQLRMATKKSHSERLCDNCARALECVPVIKQSAQAHAHAHAY